MWNYFKNCVITLELQLTFHIDLSTDAVTAELHFASYHIPY